MPADREILLPPAVIRGIGDKLYDKRKSAALEVEQLVKGLASQVAGLIGDVDATSAIALGQCRLCMSAAE